MIPACFSNFETETKKHVMENGQQKDNSRIILALVLIVVGFFWALKMIGFHFEFPRLVWHNVFYPVRHMFHGIGHFIFSWPMILIVVGLLLMAGKRTIGLVLVIVGGIFIIPKLFFFPGLSLSFALPVLLIGIGVAMVARLI